MIDTIIALAIAAMILNYGYNTFIAQAESFRREKHSSLFVSDGEKSLWREPKESIEMTLMENEQR